MTKKKMLMKPQTVVKSLDKSMKNRAEGWKTPVCHSFIRLINMAGTKFKKAKTKNKQAIEPFESHQKV